MFALVPGMTYHILPSQLLILCIVNLAVSFLIDGALNSTPLSSRKVNVAIALLTFTAVIFRAEVALLLGPVALQLLFTNRISFINLIATGLISGLFSLGSSF